MPAYLKRWISARRLPLYTPKLNAVSNPRRFSRQRAQVPLSPNGYRFAKGVRQSEQKCSASRGFGAARHSEHTGIRVQRSNDCSQTRQSAGKMNEKRAWGMDRMEENAALVTVLLEKAHRLDSFATEP